jgi:hypothetical protein
MEEDDPELALELALSLTLYWRRIYMQMKSRTRLQRAYPRSAGQTFPGRLGRHAPPSPTRALHLKWAVYRTSMIRI